MLTKDIINPKDVKKYAQQKSEENTKFRTFLKGKANPDELDKQINELHKKLFKDYDCSKCRNCCKELHCEILEAEIPKLAQHLDMSKETFIDKYLKEECAEYTTKNKSCDFYRDGKCLLEGSKPDSCENYPYTLKKDRLFSMWSMIFQAEVCPIVYEILEELKVIYNFKS